MALLDSVTPLTYRLAAGSEQNFATSIVLYYPGSTQPYPADGLTWQYVARADAADTGSPLISLTTTPGAQGVLTVTASATLTQLMVTLYPAATSILDPGTYYHALWSDPGTSSAYTWWSGTLLVTGNPQPA